MKGTVLLLFASFAFSQGKAIIYPNGDFVLTLNETSTGYDILFTKGSDLKLTGKVSSSISKLPENCKLGEECVEADSNISLNVLPVDNGFRVIWTATDLNTELRDCYDLDKENSNWYGGPEMYNQDWPIENVRFNRRPSVTLKDDNGAVGERYWLSSKGAFLHVNIIVPLFIDQNNLEKDMLCLIASVSDPYMNRTNVYLEYAIVAEDNVRDAHKRGIGYMGRPFRHPDEWIIRNPIWTTWAKYKKDISDDIVVAFAQDIYDHGFTGQIEIDDNWETCYGSLTFNDKQFPKINETVQKLKDLNFTVTLWTHPFVNTECTDVTNEGLENGYFVKSYDGNDTTSWWDGTSAHYIDFTNSEAAKWFTNRLKDIQAKHGIDSFKFDAGESDYAPPHPILSGYPTLAPSSLTTEYVRTCAEFGGLVEVRSAWDSQGLPIFVRMLDKDSRWTIYNGLHSLITTLLNFNINGYVMVLPDMIGGNGYAGAPSAELLARWTQANTFMPTMQFSYLPWEITSEDFDGLAIIKKFVKLHEDYADEIIAAMDKSIEDGSPINPPIWWIDPTNKDALKVNDEYLLGENILVAPVIVEGATARDIVIPAGSWKDGNNGDVIEGPTTLKDYPAPIDVLPYFIKQ